MDIHPAFDAEARQDVVCSRDLVLMIPLVAEHDVLGARLATGLFCCCRRGMRSMAEVWSVARVNVGRRRVVLVPIFASVLLSDRFGGRVYLTCSHALIN